jgi:hypothetical protein
MSPYAEPRPALLTRLYPWLLLLLLILAAPQPALAEGPVGIIEVTANVEGAQVWVDGEPVGVVPYTGYFPVGPHQVRVAADHHDPVVRRLDVRESMTKSLPAKLQPGAGTLEFAVQPAGASVHVDGNLVGTAPIRVRDIQPGDHSYRIEAEGYEAVEAEFSFEEGQNLLLRLELLSSAGLFQVESTPPGAAVWIDGEPVGSTPLMLTEQPPGSHKVRVALDGYAEVFRIVDTSDGRKGEVIATLREQGGKLVVKTGDDQASVSVNGSVVGQGSRVVIPSVERGSLQVAVSAPDRDPASVSVRIPIRGTVGVKASLVPVGQGSSELVILPPVYQRWTFWAATAAVAGGGVAGGVLLAKALEPPPAPEGDVVVVLP